MTERDRACLAHLDAGGDPEMPAVLAIVGATATGKTDLAMRVAESRRRRGARQVEVVAVDAFTIYRGMDIGTAKPTRAEREQVPHHLVDVLDPDDEVTVAWFQERAREVIADLHARDRDAVLVGGSGLYFRSVVDDLEFPPTDPHVRVGIEERFAGDPEGAFAELRSLDPTAAERMTEQNLRRTVRALEVITITGRPFSDYDRLGDHTSIYPALGVACLEPSREIMRARIEERAAAMVAGGLLDEARALRSRGILSVTARQAIGYREAYDVLDGDLALDMLASTIATRTWQYAKRQQGWFRRDPRCQPASAPAEILRAFG